MRYLKVPALIVFISVLIFTGCTTTQKPASNQLVISGNTMGTTYTIKIVKNNFLLLGDVSKKTKDIETGITELLGRINNKMSTYIQDSEISRFNEFRGNSWMDVSPETVLVFSNSIRISELTGGAFDITLGPLINLWGFGPDRKPVKIPDVSDIENVKKKTGYKKLSVRKDPPSLKKGNPGIYCDLSAIAKGFGVDEVASYLDSRGFYNYMVEIGGEISVRGKNSGGAEWRLGVLSPDGSNDIKEIIGIGDLALATSGDYHNYFEEEGIRYSHIIDPETGSPISHKLVSVSVVMSSCMEADALATAITVMGPDKGYEFAVKNSIPVYMIIKDGDGYKEKMTPSFSSFPVDNEKD